MNTGEIISIIFGTGTIGAIILAVINYKLAVRKDRSQQAEDRRRNFIVFMFQWRSQLQRIPHTDIPKIWDHYLAKVDAFYAEAARVHADFLGKEFWDDVDGLGDIRHIKIAGEERDKDDPRKIIAEKIDKIAKEARRQSYDT